MLYALNYANEKYKEVQSLCTRSLKKLGRVDNVFEFSPTDIDDEFRNRNSDILTQKTGNGFWLWKPYFIKKALSDINDGDFLFYIDSAAVCIKKLKILTNYMISHGNDVLCFETPFQEINWTKQSVLKQFHLENDNSFQIEATYIMFRKTEDVCLLVDQWLKFATIKNNIDNLNIDGACIEHRNDQSLFSMICKCRAIKPICSISDRYFYYTVSNYYDSYYLDGNSMEYAEIYYKKHIDDRLGWIIFSHHFGESGFILYFHILKKYIKTVWLYLKSKRIFAKGIL